MMNRLAWLLLCLPAGSAAAPAAAPDLSAALQNAKMGTTLRVEALDARRVGRLDGIDRGGLLLIEKEGRISIPLESITAVSKLESARGKGILWGAVIGLGAGVLVASQADEGTVRDDDREWLTYTYHAAVGALIGGAIGGVIGSTFNSWQPIYPPGR